MDSWSRTDCRVESGCRNVVRVNSMSPDENDEGGRGSEVRVNAAGPEMEITEESDDWTGFGHESTRSKGDPSSASTTERKADGGMELGGASKGVHVIDDGFLDSGSNAERMSSFCTDSREVSMVPLMAPNIASFLASWAVVPDEDSNAAWIEIRVGNGADMSRDAMILSFVAARSGKMKNGSFKCI